MPPHSSRALASPQPLLQTRHWIFIGFCSLFSLWLRMAFPILAVGWAAHDDLLFVQMAANIGIGHWLGGYNELTHAKGIGYPWRIQN